MRKFIVATGMALALGSQLSYAAPMDRTPSDRPRRESAPEIVRWVGEVRDDASSHTTEHWHSLEFIRQSDGEEFDIVDSPELVKLHHETEKNYLVEIEAEKTPRFLFWGGNLIVKSFRVIKESSPAIAHSKPRKSNSVGGFSRR